MGLGDDQVCPRPVNPVVQPTSLTVPLVGKFCGQPTFHLSVAAAGSAVPELTWLYFAIAQFPIYLMPAMLKPLARKIIANPSS